MEGLDTYLQNLPEDIKEYGLNKTLTTRSLTIDWKHRDTEMYLRSPELLDKVKPWFEVETIYRERANQLRYIYYVHRKLFAEQNPNTILDTFEFVKSRHFNTSLGNTFIDIGCIIDGYQQKHTIVNSVVFSYKKMKQRDMIKYLVSRDLPIPKLVISTSSLEELQSLFSKNISFILCKNTFSDIETLYLWLCNYHLYEVYDTSYSRVSFKTDTTLATPYTF